MTKTIIEGKVNYFEVLYKDCFQKLHVCLIATDRKSPYDTDYSFATGFDGCKIVDFKETTFENFRSNKRKYFI